MQIIGLGGLAGSGKTTIAKALAKRYTREGLDVRVVSFAAPIKEMMRTLLDWCGYDDVEIEELFTDYKEEPCAWLSGKSMRHALQTLGTEWGRVCIDEEFWAEIGLRVAVTSFSDVIIYDDVRFSSEADKIREAGGSVVLLERFGVHKAAKHPSEHLGYEFNHKVNNDNIEDCVLKIMDLVRKDKKNG